MLIVLFINILSFDNIGGTGKKLNGGSSWSIDSWVVHCVEHHIYLIIHMEQNKQTC